jgi:hypothetical protein
MSAPPDGPYLYDDNPEPLHTGTGRNRNWSIIVLLGLTVLLAVATVVGIYVFRGSPTDEAQERAHVFLAALAADDSETAAALLCEKARDGRTDDEALEPYAALSSATEGKAREVQENGKPVVIVPVEGAGASTELVLVPEGGPKVCGLR